MKNVNDGATMCTSKRLTGRDIDIKRDWNKELSMQRLLRIYKACP